MAVERGNGGAPTDCCCPTVVAGVDVEAIVYLVAAVDSAVVVQGRRVGCGFDSHLMRRRGHTSFRGVRLSCGCKARPPTTTYDYASSACCYIVY